MARFILMLLTENECRCPSRTPPEKRTERSCVPDHPPFDDTADLNWETHLNRQAEYYVRYPRHLEL